MERSRSRSPHGHCETFEERYYALSARYNELQIRNTELERQNNDLTRQLQRKTDKCDELEGKSQMRRYKMDLIAGLCAQLDELAGQTDSSDDEPFQLAIEDDVAGSDDEVIPQLALDYVPESTLLKVSRPFLALEDGESAVPPPRALNSSFDDPAMTDVMTDVASMIGKCKNGVLVICGAGISTSCGIRDFRSPGTGLYSTYQADGLPTPESLFTLDFFNENPAPFYKYAKENWPGKVAPSKTHFFLKLLHEKGKLLRCYTQNIDGLERQAGLNKRLVEAHGSFKMAHVANETRKKVDAKTFKNALENDELEKLRKKHGGLIKPGIVFYDEALPRNLWRFFEFDKRSAELLLVLGTSIAIDWVEILTMSCYAKHKVFVNLGEVMSPWERHGDECGWSHSLKVECDAACEELARHLGWSDDLQRLYETGKVAVEQW